MSKDNQKKIDNIELQKKAHEIMKEKGKNKDYSRAELNIIAKSKGIKYYYDYSKYDLAEKLGIELLKPKPKQPKGKACRKARSVEITNPDGTTTTYSSISKAAKAFGRLPLSLYTMAANGEIKIN